MENNILEKEEITTGTVEDVTDEVNELRESCTAENLEEPIEEISIPDEPTLDESTDESVNQAVEEATEETTVAPATSEIEVAPIEKAEDLVPEEQISEKPSQQEENDEDALPFFKTVKWQRTWSRCSAIILALLFAIPLGILAYTVLTFFL